MSNETLTRQNKPAAISISAARPTCDVHSSAIIAERAILSGSHEIKIGADSIVQPYAKLHAEGGNILIGDNCTVAEAVVLEVPGETEGEIVLGDNICIESSAHITSATIGDGTEIGIQAIVGAGAVIGKYCKIAPKQVIAPSEHLPDYTVVYGDHQRRLDTSLINHGSLQEARIKGQAMHVGVLKQLIPDASSRWTTT